MHNSWTRPVEILLVEDDASSCRLIKESLHGSRIDSHISWVKDGQEAMDFLTHADVHTNAPRPDLIFLDLNMPRKSGLDVLAEIKTDASLKRIPVIVMTASCDQVDVNAVYDLHANCYLRKSADFEELSAQIRLIEDFWFAMVLWPTAEPVAAGSRVLKKSPFETE